MMPIEKRLEMYKNKKLFVDSISKVFEIKSLQSNVTKIEYEVLTKQINEDVTAYYEFVIVTLTSGSKCIRSVSGTSNNGIFQELGKLINGGYYDEVDYYNSFFDNGFTKLEL